jgi:hypothetical protein
MPNNSVLELVDTLKKFPFLTENQLMEKTYGYRRGHSVFSNKKYADLIRRALYKGLISRVEVKLKTDKSRFRYYV